MNNKDGFLIYKSQYSPIKILTTEEKSELLDAIFSYQIEGKIGDLSPRVCIAFAFIKNQFEIDNAKYKMTCEKNSINGSKGGRPGSNKPKKPSGLYSNPKNPDEPQKADNDKDNGKDNDKDKKYNRLSQVVFTSKKSDLFKEFIERFNKVTNRRYTVNKKLEGQLNARIKEGRTLDEIIQALENAKKVKYHIESNFNYLTPEFISRADKLNAYLNYKQNGNTTHSSNSQQNMLHTECYPGKYENGPKL